MIIPYGKSTFNGLQKFRAVEFLKHETRAGVILRSCEFRYAVGEPARFVNDRDRSVTQSAQLALPAWLCLRWNEHHVASCIQKMRETIVGTYMHAKLIRIFFCKLGQCVLIFRISFAYENKLCVQLGKVARHV